MKFNNEEKEDVFLALSYWANFIETGNLATSAKDAENSGKKFKALTSDQMKKVIRLRDLAAKVVNAD